jgi:hypothetical protein
MGMAIAVAIGLAMAGPVHPPSLGDFEISLLGILLGQPLGLWRRGIASSKAVLPASLRALRAPDTCSAAIKLPSYG